MNLSRIALISAAASVLLWAAKAVAIGVAGGLGHSALENPLFLLGFVCHVIAVATLALSWTAAASVALRVLSVLGCAVAGALVATAIGGAVDAIAPSDPGWVWGEINLWIVAPVVLAVARVTDRRSGRGEVMRTVRPRTMTT